ncbi:hypothetical protein DRQ27_00855 [bacterium]|nr:MAG: hypothetical protein DRQ27_00855 [bacterium]
MKSKLIILVVLVSVLATLFASTVTKYKVVAEKCIGCRICVLECPVGAISIVNGKAVIDPEKCTGCGICVKACSTGAIVAVVDSSVEEDTTAAKNASIDSAKYDSLRGKAAKKDTSVSVAKTSPNSAIAEKTDVKVKKDTLKTTDSLAAKTDSAKIEKPTEKKPTKKPVAKLIAVVDKDKCIGCKTCENTCKYDAIKVIDGKAVVDPEKCTGCGDCVKACPLGAIKLKKLSQ